MEESVSCPSTSSSLQVLHPLFSTVSELATGRMPTQAWDCISQLSCSKMWLCDWILASGKWVEIKCVTSGSFPWRGELCYLLPFFSPSFRLKGRCSGKLLLPCKQWQCHGNSRAARWRGGKSLGPPIPLNLHTSLRLPTSTVTKEIVFILLTIIFWGLVVTQIPPQ